MENSNQKHPADEKYPPYFCSACNADFSQSPKVHTRSLEHQNKLKAIFLKKSKGNIRQKVSKQATAVLKSRRRKEEIEEAKLILDAAALSSSNVAMQRAEVIENLKAAVESTNSLDCDFCYKQFGSENERRMHQFSKHSLQAAAFNMLQAKNLLHTIYDLRLAI